MLLDQKVHVIKLSSTIDRVINLELPFDNSISLPATYKLKHVHKYMCIIDPFSLVNVFLQIHIIREYFFFIFIEFIAITLE